MSSISTVRGGPRGVVTDGLVLWLDASYPQSYPGFGTTWSDLTINRNNGTLLNGPTFSSANGGSIQFDGTNDYAAINHSETLNTVNVTVSIWLKYLSAPYGDTVLFAKGNLFVVGGRTYWFYENGGLEFAYQSAFTNKIPSAQLNNGQWHNITGTYDSLKLTIYFDGIQYGSQVNYLSTTTNTNNIGINAYPEGTYIASNKNIASIIVYNRSLSNAEVLQNYNATKTRFGL